MEGSRSRSCSILISGRHVPPPLPLYESSIDSEHTSETLWMMSRRKKIVLICLVLGTMKCFLCLSLLAPFYPGEAKSRGIGQFASSWVFSVFSLTQVITAPLVGKAIPTVGARFLYISGAFVGASCTILFGFLDMFPRDDGPLLYLTFSFVIRIVMAMGCTAWFTSGFAIAMTTFRGNAATVMGLLETAVGVGMVLAPAIGGGLYVVGGFLLPFLCLGLLVYLFIPLYFLKLESTQERTKPGSVFTILRTPWAWILCAAMVALSILLVVLEPILEIHLKKFGVSSAEVGLAFFICSGTYAISATITGVIVDRITESRILVIIGFALLVVAFFFLGPSPLTPLVQYQALWLKLVCVTIVGLAAGQAVVPTYQLLMIAALRSGMPDNLSTHGAVSGLWTSLFALGETVGPVMSGWLTEDYGFDWATTVFAILAALMVIMMVPFTIYVPLKTKDPPLLASPSVNQVGGDNCLGESLAASSHGTLQCDSEAAAMTAVMPSLQGNPAATCATSTRQPYGSFALLSLPGDVLPAVLPQGSTNQ